MKSRTSFFNATVLKKDITRFAPLWVLYTVFLMILFLSAEGYDPVITASNLRNLTSTITIANLLYGGLCANILFGDLFQSRMCNALHAMPMRREGWFLTHVCAGLLFSVLPNIVGSLLYMILLEQYWYMALLWLAVAVLGFLFFFGLGLFSIMCAGNRLGMAAVYAIINFFAVLVYVLVKGVYEPLLHGFEFVAEPFLFFCPVYYLSDNRFLTFDYDYVADRYVNGHIEAFFPEMWWYLAVAAVLGLVLTGLAILLYRRRRLECAGDFLATKALEPVFLIIYTLAFSVFFYALTMLFGFATFNGYLFMIIGTVVGFFTGSMLIKRTVWVFQKKTFIGFAVFTAALIASLILSKADPLQITWYAPDTDEIAHIQIYTDSDRSRLTTETPYQYRLETPQQIEAFRDVHTILMEERWIKTDGCSNLYIHYTLKNGREVIRYYTIDERTAAYDTLQMYFSDYQYLFNCTSWDALTNGYFTTLSLSLFDYYEKVETTEPVATELLDIEIEDQEKIDLFIEALRKDCDAGNMAQSYTFHVAEENVAWCYLSTNIKDERGIISQNGGLFRELMIYPSAVHTTALLEQWAAEIIAE